MPTPSGMPPVVVPPFVPGTTQENDQVVMGLTLPNGDHLDLLYGPDLDLAAMGAQPDLTVVRPGTTERIPLSFVHDPTPGSEYLAEGPIDTYAGPDGTDFEVWRPGSLIDKDAVLALPTEHWTVLAPLDPELDAGLYAASLRPVETQDGYVVIETLPPLGLAVGYGEAGGPQVGIGDLDPRPDAVLTANDGLTFIQVAPAEQCSRQVSPSDGYALLCLVGGTFLASVQGPPAFVLTVAQELEARAFER
jgi:hypothetical protein